MLKAGIVGLPNVGKSTLFNAVTRTRKAEAANYPFCTIDPNVGVVTVPDERLAALQKIAKTNVVIPAAIEFVDIAGLVRGAGGIAEGVPPHLADAMLPKFRAGGLLITYAGGGAGLFSSMVAGWANGTVGSEPVTRAVGS